MRNEPLRYRHSLDAARTKAEQDLETALARLSTHQTVLGDTRQELKRTSLQLSSLQVQLTGYSSNPVTYVAGLKFVAEVHQRVWDLRIRIPRLDLELQHLRALGGVMSRRKNMLNEHRLDELRNFHAYAQQRSEAELAADWIAHQAWRKGGQ